MAEQWQIKGDFIDFCKCSVPCPCSWGQAPTEGDCDGVIGYRIREGHYGDVQLDGLNVAGLGQLRGQHLGRGNEDERRIRSSMSGPMRASGKRCRRSSAAQAGSWPQVFAENVLGEMLGMEFAPIELEIADDASSWSIEIPGMAKRQHRGPDRSDERARQAGPGAQHPRLRGRSEQRADHLRGGEHERGGRIRLQVGLGGPLEQAHSLRMVERGRVLS